MAGMTGKTIKLFFDDMGKVLVKEGVVISDDAVFIQIKTFKGVEGIPTCKVVRVEVLK